MASPSFSDRVVIVTGASSGIGAYTAIEFARRGALVAIIARSKDGLEETAKNCQAAGANENNILCVQADVTIQENVEKGIKTIVEKFGKIDILVNNVGAAWPGRFDDCSVEDMEKHFNINTKSAFIVTKACIEQLVKTKGNIVNVSSLAGIRALPELFAYGMSKAALEHFTKCLALDYAERGVRVNAVSPGLIATDVFLKNGMVQSREQLADFFAEAGKLYPLGRVGEPDDVAKAILFLASDASYTTGVSLPIDGGRHESLNAFM